jgi:ABC-type spermidine/putrescine transport system permease subunit II
LAGSERWPGDDAARPPRSGARTALLLICSPIFVYLLVPTLIVVPMAFTPEALLQFPPGGVSLRPFRALFADPAWVGAGVVSLKAAALAVALGGVVATLAALGMHAARFAGKGAVQGVIMVPLVAPLIVLALADYQFLAPARLVGTWVGIGLAHSVLAVPYVYITTQASLAGLDPALVRSARGLGAGHLALFRHVYLPALRPGLLAGALFAFAASFDEAVIALFLQGPHATTLPVKIFTDIQYDLTPKIAAVASLLVGLATLVFATQAAMLLRRPRYVRASRGAA